MILHDSGEFPNAEKLLEYHESLISCKTELRVKLAGAARWGSATKAEVRLKGGDGGEFDRCLWQETGLEYKLDWKNGSDVL